MDLDSIRELTVTALFSDDLLMEQLVLKGGNALRLVYRLGARSSLDLDFSIEGDFADFEGVKNRILRALQNRFSSVGLFVFDTTFEHRPLAPRESQDERWGGYQLAFKLIETSTHLLLQGDPDKIRRHSLVLGPDNRRKFLVDISKFEYCAGKREVDLDDYTIFVYSPAMIAVEKLRAICQQMPEYAPRRTPAPRARDFYDIHLLVTEAGVDLAAEDNRELIVRMFAAKDVPLSLIDRIPGQREFHRPDWPAVQSSVAAKLEEFDFYFNFVVEQAAGLNRSSTAVQTVFY